MNTRQMGCVLATVLTLTLSGRASADGLVFGANAGVGSSYGHTYYEVGARLGYGLGMGLTPELGLAYWGGATPTFYQLSAGVTWYVPLPVIRPYVGGFYAHDFLSSGFSDQDGIGVRGGIGLLGLGPLSVNIGIAYERRLSCPADCDTWWPEASAGISF
jgi:hypothetical protein